MNILIVDDEAPARELVQNYLLQHSEKHHIAEASNGFEALKIIQKNKPDVVLLDIQMPKLNGFEVLELLPEKLDVIFCTAYDEYALKAFEKNAIDYLLKPFSKERLFEALAKVQKGSSSILPAVLNELSQVTNIERIVVKNNKELAIIPVDDILYLKAADDYVEIHTASKKYLKQQRLKYYESALDSDEFVRIHRQFIVKLSAITKLDKWGKESYLTQLSNGATATVSAKGYALLRQKLDI